MSCESAIEIEFLRLRRQIGAGQARHIQQRAVGPAGETDQQIPQMLDQYRD